MREIVIAIPSPHTSMRYQALQGAVFRFEFDPSVCTFTKKHNDLEICFDNSSTVSLDSFFSVLHKGDMTFALPDGNMISARDFASAFLGDPEDQVFFT